MSTIIDIFYNIPNTSLLIIMIIIGVTFTILGIRLVKIFIPIELRLKDNVAIGYISASIGVLYAILAGFVTLHMLTNFSRAKELVRLEANQVEDIYRDAPRLDSFIATEIQKEIRKYTETVISQEWPTMQQGKIVDSYGEKILTNLRNQLTKYQSKNIDQSLAKIDIYDEIEELYNVREERLAMNQSFLEPSIWLVLIIGTIFIIIISMIYGMEHNLLHTVLSPLVSIMAMSLLFIIISIDRPFRGSVSIQPTEFKTALKFMSFESKLLSTN